MGLNPRVTWLISVRNGMPYLPSTLNSIANQTYKNHEIIALDNGSKDATLEELRRWIPSRIPGRILVEESLRLGPCRALLVEQADTELCAVIDGDDIAYPHRLERQVSYILEHPRISVLGSYAQGIDANAKEENLWKYPTGDADTRWQMRFSTQVLHPALMFRRSAILAAGNYPDFKWEDSTLWARMSLMNFEFHNIPEPLIKYRRTNTSATGSMKDWLPLNRDVARFCASIIFPGIPDPEEAMELWEATRPNEAKVHTKLRHLKALKQTAVAHARLVGKPDDYFLNCDAFKAQLYHVHRRILEGLGLGPVLRLRRRIRARPAASGRLPSNEMAPAGS